MTFQPQIIYLFIFPCKLYAHYINLLNAIHMFYGLSKYYHCKQFTKIHFQIQVFLCFLYYFYSHLKFGRILSLNFYKLKYLHSVLFFFHFLQLALQIIIIYLQISYLCFLLTYLFLQFMLYIFFIIGLQKFGFQLINFL